MDQAVVVAAKRTAFGKYNGTLKHLEPEQLLRPSFQHFKGKYPEVISKIDDIVLDNVVGNDGNIAREALLEARLRDSIPGVTTDRQCGSEPESAQYTCCMIQARAGKAYVVGGVEDTSRAPWKVKRPHPMYETALPELHERASSAPEVSDPSMIQGTENMAKMYDASRKLQDESAYRNHQLTAENAKSGNASQEILPITIKGEISNADESLKPHTSRGSSGRFKPVIKGGTITAANSCTRNDGAVLLPIMEKDMAYELGSEHGLLFKDSIAVGVDSNFPGIGPVPIISNLLKRNQLMTGSIEVIEIDEAFSTQVVACQQALNISNTQLNIRGGALTSGHSYGAGGAQLVTRLFYMSDKETMITSIGVGGSLGNATLPTRF